jgi:hypothetical protein
MGRSIILSSFQICLASWPPCFVKCFLWTTMNSSWITSQIPKGGVFSFFYLCSNACIPYKVNVVKGRLLHGLDNTFAFAIYSRMFPPFARCTPLVAFFNGGYNFSLRGFPLESATLSHPFFRCSLILIFEFFLQWL